MRVNNPAIAFLSTLMIFQGCVVQSAPADITLLENIIETQKDIHWMVYHFRFAVSDYGMILERLQDITDKSTIPMCFNLLMMYLDTENLDKSRLQNIVSLEYTMIDNLRTHKGVIGPSPTTSNTELESLRQEWHRKRNALDLLSDAIKPSLVGLHDAGFPLIHNEEHLTAKVEQLRTKYRALKRFRLSARFLIPEVSQSALIAIINTIEQHTFKLVPAHLDELRILFDQIAGSRPGQSLFRDPDEPAELTRLDGLAAGDRHANRLLWEANHWLDTREQIIDEVRNTVISAIDQHPVDSNQSESITLPKKRVIELLSNIINLRREIHLFVSRAYLESGAIVWDFLLYLRSVSTPEQKEFHSEVITLVRSFHGPRIPTEEMILPEQETLEMYQNGGALSLESSLSISRIQAVNNALTQILQHLQIGLGNPIHEPIDHDDTIDPKNTVSDDEIVRDLMRLVRIRAAVVNMMYYKIRNPICKITQPNFELWKGDHRGDVDYTDFLIEVENLINTEEDYWNRRFTQTNYVEYQLIDEIKDLTGSRRKITSVGDWASRRLKTLHKIKQKMLPRLSQS